MLRHSKTTQQLVSSLSKIKQQKRDITERLKDNIVKNQEYFENHQQRTIKYSQKIFVNRGKSIEILQKKLNHKLKMDDQNNIKLLQIEKQNSKMKQELEKRIEEINNRNINRMKQLQQIQEKMLKKIQSNLSKNQIKEKSLKQKYRQIQSEQKKVHDTKVYQKKESLQQWKILQSQKWRLEGIVKQHEQKQKTLIIEKNPIPLKREQKIKKIDQKYIPTQKEYAKLKDPSKIDHKSVGNKYLEQVKIMHRQNIVKKNNKKLMNINLKVINYGSEIMQRIFRNTSDLSKFNQAANNENMVEKIAGIQVQIQPITNSKMHRFEFKQADDQTQKYLRQIKQNLEQLQKHNKDIILEKDNPQNQVKEHKNDQLLNIVTTSKLQ